MKRDFALGLAITAAAAAAVGVLSSTQRVRAAQPPAVAPAAPSDTGDPGNALIRQYCVGCHNEKTKSGSLSLADFDATRAAARPEIAERMIHKLRAGMMPPSGSRRPQAPSLAALAASLEHQIDTAAAVQPNPGRRALQRLNRAEYARAIRQIFDVDIDVEAFLPPDTISHNFDNIADVQSFSPTLMEGYLRAARQVTLEALGDRAASPRDATYRVPRTASQMVHVEGTPLGTRGGIFVTHNFPADGSYRFKMSFHGTDGGVLWGASAQGERIEVSIDGARAALLDIDSRMSETDPSGLTLQTAPIAVTAGPHRIAAAFVQRADGPVDDLIAPIAHTLAGQQIGDSYGITVLPHLRDLTIGGPFEVTGLSETPSRRRLLTCRPATPAHERGCARTIVARIARAAFRRSLTPADLDDLLGSYDEGRRTGDFVVGVRVALQAVLTDPEFLFRLEQQPAGTRSGQIYRLADRELASRLAFFLWATGPDEELLKLAGVRALQKPGVLAAQVRRMLADPRANSLSTRFAAQWLRLQDLDKLQPDAILFPEYDARLGEAMRRETELFFDSIVREDRSVFDLLTADYTFLNERLATHYGVPNVAGSAFRRVSLPDERRRGLLGQGSILTLTSVADRTSPVQRGKWVLEVLFGSPPPPPPPNVPAFDDTKAVNGTRTLSVRERMEEHRRNPACASCHRVIDPIGLALENFDSTGRWRIKDNAVPVDASGTLYDGTVLNGPAGLRQALVEHGQTFVTTFVENLMAYALGRRVEYFDMPAIRAIVRSAAPEHRLSSYVLGIVNSAAFQMSRAETSDSAKVERDGIKGVVGDVHR